MHICQDEIFALLYCLPFIGVAWSAARARYRAWRGTSHATCDHTHHEKP